jgi:hypothetical protein
MFEKALYKTENNNCLIVEEAGYQEESQEETAA